jgi:hypothetical protein
VHPRQQQLSRGGGYAGALKLKDFPSLSADLDAHPLNFGTYVL